MDTTSIAALQRRTETLERRLRRFQTGTILAVATATAIAGISFAQADAKPAVIADATQPGVLRAAGIILVDEQGRDRIAIGAPWPTMHGRTSDAVGTGMLIVDESGVDRINVASPAPDPPGGGKRIAVANGVTWYDQKGNERGGVGYLDNGRSVLVLDNDHGEGAGIFSFSNGYVGMGIMKQGQFRALMEHSPDQQATSLTLSDDAGRPRARLRVAGKDAATFDLLDEHGNPTPAR